MQTRAHHRRENALLWSIRNSTFLFAALAAVTAAGDTTITNGIQSVAPTFAQQGATNVAVTFTLSASVTPPPPPATVPPSSAKIGSINGSTVAHPSQYVVTASFNISAGEVAGLKDVSVAFPSPSGILTYNRLLAFEVLVSSNVTAGFSGTPLYGLPPLTVSFTNVSAGPFASQFWSFGDGAISAQRDPAHVYSNPASYAVSLTVVGPLDSNTLTRAAYICVTTNIGAYPVVDTGQVKCYNETTQIAPPSFGQAFYGQDAQFGLHAPSYTRSGDGLTVHDNVTGLTWQRSPETTGDGIITAADKFTWAQAQLRPAALNATNFGGFNDWRLPTIKELYSLIDFRGTDPSFMYGDTSVLTPFINTDYFAFAYGDTNAGERVIDSQYASSTLYVAPDYMGENGKLFGVNFADGRIKGYGLTLGGSDKTFFVQCVRGNTAYGLNLFVDNGDQTVSDLATGLMWSKADSGVGMNWSNALAWVQTRNAASYLGHSDWRLPSAKELQSILDYARSPDTTGSAAMDQVFQCTVISDETRRVDYPWYWSGTTHARSTGSGAAGAYVCCGRGMGYMNSAWADVHGAGCQRSDPKGGSLSDYTYVPYGYYSGNAPQGDAVRIYNYVRLVRDSVPEPTACGWLFGLCGLALRRTARR